MRTEFIANIEIAIQVQGQIVLVVVLDPAIAGKITIYCESSVSTGGGHNLAAYTGKIKVVAFVGRHIYHTMDIHIILYPWNAIRQPYIGIIPGATLGSGMKDISTQGIESQ
jgi:hypothetical protein